MARERKMKREKYGGEKRRRKRNEKDIELGRLFLCVESRVYALWGRSFLKVHSPDRGTHRMPSIVSASTAGWRAVGDFPLLRFFFYFLFYICLFFQHSYILEKDCGTNRREKEIFGSRRETGERWQLKKCEKVRGKKRELSENNNENEEKQENEQNWENNIKLL